MHDIIVTGVSLSDHEERSSVFLIDYIREFEEKRRGKICVGNIVNMKN